MPGIFRGLAADQGAARFAAAGADAADDRFGDRELKRAGGVIVEKEQWLGAADDEVVDAHGDKVDADAVVPAKGEGELELGANAVGGGDEHRLAVARGNLAEPAEAANAREDFRPRGGAGDRGDAVDKRVAPVDIDPGVPVSQALFHIFGSDRFAS